MRRLYLMAVVASGLLFVASSAAHAQRGGTLGGTISPGSRTALGGNNAGASGTLLEQMGTSGQVTGSERYLRTGRQPYDFVGNDVAEGIGFVGVVGRGGMNGSTAGGIRVSTARSFNSSAGRTRTALGGRSTTGGVLGGGIGGNAVGSGLRTGIQGRGALGGGTLGGGTLRGGALGTGAMAGLAGTARTGRLGGGLNTLGSGAPGLGNAGMVNRGMGRAAPGGGIVPNGGARNGLQAGAPGRAGTTRAITYRTQLRVGFRYQSPSAPVVQARLQERLNERVQANSPVQVDFQDQVATLRGVVASESERQLAAQLAQLEPGVAQVRNELVVAPPASQPADR